MSDIKSYDHHIISRDDINVENQLIKEHKDRSGNVLRDKFDIHGKLIWREKLINSKKDKTTSKVITQFTRNDKGSITNRHDEIYSASGELIRLKELVRTGEGKSLITNITDTTYLDGVISLQVETKENHLKNLISKLTNKINSHGTTTSLEEYQYDKDNNLINVTEIVGVFGSDGKFTGGAKTNKIVTSNGVISNQEYNKINGEGKTIFSEVNQFDSLGNVNKNTKRTVYNDEIKEVIKYKDIDANGKINGSVEEEIIYYEGNHTVNSKSIFDSKRNLIQTVEVYQKEDTGGNLVLRYETSKDFINHSQSYIDEKYEGNIISK
ncbi:hypothetical protein, partial [Yersinia massiliensis]